MVLTACPRGLPSAGRFNGTLFCAVLPLLAGSFPADPWCAVAGGNITEGRCDDLACRSAFEEEVDGEAALHFIQRAAYRQRLAAAGEATPAGEALVGPGPRPPSARRSSQPSDVGTGLRLLLAPSARFELQACAWLGLLPPSFANLAGRSAEIGSAGSAPTLAAERGPSIDAKPQAGLLGAGAGRSASLHRSLWRSSGLAGWA
eukprot:CAMPEP_0203911458 /NCGR_PEP_ID=MMETSP0359-20131031/52623_1 /ASSEMBLY_ACC=CAM_ASM_000338 /TAXON_ID=268821 /ORGANISM="Scrippsiella Hangoei, Strain SHTV-5" /LENGTH=202 /DNA_ID=CAMNT_0050837169 /DNA_START=86 /DNA_END=690 /DNA_ORIENTATION=+